MDEVTDKVMVYIVVVNHPNDGYELPVGLFFSKQKACEAAREARGQYEYPEVQEYEVGSTEEPQEIYWHGA